MSEDYYIKMITLMLMEEYPNYQDILDFTDKVLLEYDKNEEVIGIMSQALYFMDRKIDAFDSVIKAFELDPNSNSHIASCWQASGSLFQLDKNWSQTVKCYNFAFANGYSGVHYLKTIYSLRSLQMHLRDFEGCHDTSVEIFKKRPNYASSWINLAMTSYLTGNVHFSIFILHEFCEIYKNKKIENKNFFIGPYEFSEILLFKNSLIPKGMFFRSAYKDLRSNINYYSKTSLKFDMIASYFLNNRKYSEASELAGLLIYKNPDNVKNYELLFESKKLYRNDEKYSECLLLLESLPDETYPKLLSYSYLNGDDFESAIDKFLQRSFSKGVPSLFVLMKRFYKDDSKIYTIHKLVASYLINLSNNGKLANTIGREPRATEMWIYYYIAQSLLFVNKTEPALTAIDKAIERLPNMPDFYLTKAKIYKKISNICLAVECIEKAFAIEPTDRYIITKLVRYLFKINDIKRAKYITSNYLGRFDEDDYNIEYLQCVWYPLEHALAYERLADYDEALKKCDVVYKIFTNYEENMLQFHNYSPVYQKSLLYYTDVVNCLGEFKRCNSFKKTAMCAVRCQIVLFDENLYEIDCVRKKNKKTRKMKSKAKSKLIEGLNCVKNYINDLYEYFDSDVKTHVLCYQFYMRKKKYLLATRAVSDCHRLSPNHPDVIEIVFQFKILFDNIINKRRIKNCIKDVIVFKLKNIWKDRNVESMYDDYCTVNGRDFEKRLSLAKIYCYMDEKNKSDALNYCTKFYFKGDLLAGVTIDSCIKVLQTINSGFFGKCKEKCKSFREDCKIMFPSTMQFFDNCPEDLINNIK